MVERTTIGPETEATGDPGAATEIRQRNVSGPDTWRQLVDESPDGVLLVRDGRIVYVNPALARMAGREVAELGGTVLADLVPSEHRVRHAELVEETLSGDARSRQMGSGRVVHLRRADESELPVEIALAPLVIDGRPTMLATVRDATAWRGREAERARLVQLLDLVPDSILVVDPRLQVVVDANHAATELLGYTEDELRGMPVRRLAALHDESPDHVAEGEVLLTDGSQLHGQRLATRDGSVVDCEVHASLVEDPDHGPLLVNVVRDVGERLALEMRLRESEESFRTTFEQAPVGIGLLERDEADGGPLRVLRTNRALDEMLGYAAGELVGADIAVLRAPEDRLVSAAQRAQAETDRPDRTVIRRYRRRDGSVLWAEVRVSMLDLPVPGQYYLVHAVDVSTRVAAERELRRDSIVNRAVAEVSRAALEDQPEEDILTLLADGVAEAIDADGVAVLLMGDSDEPSARWVGASGPRAVDLIERVDAAGRELLVESATTAVGAMSGWATAIGAEEPDIGPVLLVPLGESSSDPHGLVAACRGQGASALSIEDDHRVTRMVTQAQVAVRLARARAAEARLAVLEERQRIARDLHDTVIQDVIAVGMQISADVDVESDPRRQVRDLEKVAQLEAAARNLRRAVFELRATVRRTSTAAEVTETVSEASRVLGHFPLLTIAGPVDDLPPDLVDDVIAVLREALSNVARHARATHSAVSLSVDSDAVILVVEDDGVGPEGAAGGCYGLANLKDRAGRHGGHVEVAGLPDAGTRVIWTCPRQAPFNNP
ncbi:PAS domain S-box protein [Nostocoides sp. F2B08]|uniref:sensor histidine kinase n=1 Tax=Nostocoides sp. F2B08 TaxID=2653936 RepID=UPI00186B24E1|nr:PAS domain S-box protein [Tetrasphaera sp. F2B08]